MFDELSYLLVFALDNLLILGVLALQYLNLGLSILELFFNLVELFTDFIGRPLKLTVDFFLLLVSLCSLARCLDLLNRGVKSIISCVSQWLSRIL